MDARQPIFVAAVVDDHQKRLSFLILPERSIPVGCNECFEFVLGMTPAVNLPFRIHSELQRAKETMPSGPLGNQL